MSQPKIKVVHFHNGTGGGVLSVIRNLLAYRQHPDIENHVIYTINREQLSDFKMPALDGATSEQVFYYSSQWNFYHTCRQLAKLLPDQDAVIVAHDWLELGMVSNLGLKFPVVQFVHGDYDYYYNLSVRHEAWVDSYICISDSICSCLKARLPYRTDSIYYLRFPVSDVASNAHKMEGFHIVFAGRCEAAKGYFILPEINKLLKQSNIQVQWHIAGPGSEEKYLQAIWESKNVKFYGNLSQLQLQDLLNRSHAFVLPSVAEGMPVSVVEAMKAGAVPVVNDLKGGLQELVQEGVTGFRIANNDPKSFAERLKWLANNSIKKALIAAAAKDYANTRFDPYMNTKLVEDILLKETEKSRVKIPLKTYGSRLDHPWIPNIITTTIRKAKSICCW